MKQQVRLLLTLLFVSFCAVQSAWADRVAPQLPEAVAPVSGQSYYLYNVLEDKFLCCSSTSTSNPAIGTYGEKITITYKAANEAWTIQFASNNYYWWAYDSYVTTSSYTGSGSYFTISESSRGYTIQRSPKNTDYYKADEFIGYNGNNGDRLNPALAEGSIHWQFMPVEEAEYYFAKHKLFTYLNIADQYNFYVTQYDQVYNNPASTTEELNQAYEVLYDAVTMSANYVSPEWTDYPILFQNNTNNKWQYVNGELMWQTPWVTTASLTSTLTGTVNVDEDVTLVYDFYSSNNYNSLRVYLDGQLVQTIANIVSNKYDKKRHYYIEMPAGKHDITWECVFNRSSSSGSSYYYHYLSGIGIEKTPTMVVNTTVEGQLGTEILKQTDIISNVRKIVINGVIGAEDWNTIGLLNNAFTVDMSNATALAGIPASGMRGSKMPFLHSVKLPEGLTSIGEYAFYDSDIEDNLTLPNTLLTIGRRAFYGTKLKGAYMPNSVTSVGESAFNECYYLENASWSSAAATIPECCFSSCWNLRTFEIPEGVTVIENAAFLNASQFNPRFPVSLKEIGYRAFNNSGIDEVIINENVTCDHAFQECRNLVYAEFPTTYYNVSGYYSGSPVQKCSKLKDVYLKSPTVVTNQSLFFDGCTNNELTLHVPSFLVSAYKLDSYWYKYNIVGFNTADVTDWTIKKDVTLNAGERFEGAPNINIIEGASLSVNGDDAMTINDFRTNADGTNTTNRAQVISSTNNVSITGNYTYAYYTKKNKWYFISLPFDVKASNITSPNCSHAVRYYDGATRATLGTGSSWKNYAQDDIIPAGTGFIYQTSMDCWSKFVAENNATKNYVFSRNEFVKALEANPSEVTANKGWNLVGNPWLSYYNIHKLNFTAPITVWNNYNERYEAYSIIDDDYAILPSQAFFVQCPDEINSISFPIDGRQLTSVIESQNAAPALNPAESQRKLIDIELSDGEKGDKTRVVINPQAKMDYETQCDASKFFSMSSNVPQLFTVQNNVEYAINERPADNGVVMLGVLIPADGSYTLQVSRNNLEEAFVYDKQTGTEANLLTSSYSFNAEAGMNTNRFELRLKAGNTTGISLTPTLSQGKGAYYDLNGRRVEQPSKGVYIQNGKKVVIK